jgi:hypothetical protein
MPRYLEFDIDPETVRIDADVPFLEHLEEAVQTGIARATRKNKFVLIFFHEATVEELDGTVKTYPSVAYLDKEPDFFAKDEYQCPEYADEEWARQNLTPAGEPQPRPFPSIMIRPDGRVITSKPSLCEGCVHRLAKARDGHCAFKPYQALPGIVS